MFQRLCDTTFIKMLKNVIGNKVYYYARKLNGNNLGVSHGKTYLTNVP